MLQCNYDMLKDCADSHNNINTEVATANDAHRRSLQDQSTCGADVRLRAGDAKELTTNT